MEFLLHYITLTDYCIVKDTFKSQVITALSNQCGKGSALLFFHSCWSREVCFQKPPVTLSKIIGWFYYIAVKKSKLFTCVGILLQTFITKTI